MRHHHPIRFPRDSRGVGLIEVLIGILVLAIGLLGVAALQATTLRNSQGAMGRSQATIETYSILDAMRANIKAATNGAYNIATCTAPGNGTLAKADVTAWLADLKAQLGQSTTLKSCGKIEQIDPLNLKLIRITVSWEDERGSGLPQTISTVTQL